MNSTSIIVGNSANVLLSDLSEKLRLNTTRRASELDSTVYRTYQPWLCLRSLRKCNFAEALLQVPHSSSVPIADESHLLAIEQFLEENRDILKDHLPGNPDAWQIFTDVARTRPKMLIQFAELIEFVFKNSEFFASVYPALVSCLIPMRQRKPQGLSNVFMRGAIFLSFEEEYSQISLALDLVHEMGHQALFLWQSVDPLMTSSWTEEVYSEIRREPRPAILCFHAAAALAYMWRFALDSGNPDYIHDDFDISLDKVLRKAITSLRNGCDLTPLGSHLLNEFESLC